MADSPPADVAERITVGVPPARAYQAVSDVHRMARWSPECWRDQRGPGAHVLGRIFTGRVANYRAEANREGMRTTLARLKRELEAGRSAS